MSERCTWGFKSVALYSSFKTSHHTMQSVTPVRSYGRYRDVYVYTQFVCVEACAYECNFTNTPRTAALWCALLQHISSASNPATQMQDRQSASDTTAGSTDVRAVLKYHIIHKGVLRAATWCRYVGTMHLGIQICSALQQLQN